jgi:hypothetical protein
MSCVWSDYLYTWIILCYFNFPPIKKLKLFFSRFFIRWIFWDKLKQVHHSYKNMTNRFEKCLTICLLLKNDAYLLMSRIYLLFFSLDSCTWLVAWSWKNRFHIIKKEKNILVDYCCVDDDWRCIIHLHIGRKTYQLLRYTKTYCFGRIKWWIALKRNQMVIVIV